MNRSLLKETMFKRQITQSQLASEIGISQSSLSRKIRGEREFRLSEVLAICEILGIENPKEIFLTT